MRTCLGYRVFVGVSDSSCRIENKSTSPLVCNCDVHGLFQSTALKFGFSFIFWTCQSFSYLRLYKYLCLLGNLTVSSCSNRTSLPSPFRGLLWQPHLKLISLVRSWAVWYFHGIACQANYCLYLLQMYCNLHDDRCIFLFFILITTLSCLYSTLISDIYAWPVMNLYVSMCILNTYSYMYIWHFTVYKNYFIQRL